MRYRLTTPVLPAFFIVFSALLAGCSSTPHANDGDAQSSTKGTETAAAKNPDGTDADSDQPAFDLTVKAPDDVRKYLEQYIDLKRYRSFPGLQLTELTRL